ncbi:MAG: hypothetical protein LBJ02_08725 [Bifidobacteriaceae bacterium]|jgi:hypothetical protein|nr:hypothetical protein [Bifidobacteriaceae bacterium]
MNAAITVDGVTPNSPEAAEWLGLLARRYPDWRWRGGSPRDEADLLEGRHFLSPGLEFVPLLARRGTEAVGRCAVTFYRSGPAAYLGFFECLDLSAAPALFDSAKEMATRRGATELIGPVDASFWLGYRMKLDHFDARPYFGEPYNRPEYPDLWSEAGFSITDRYSSTFYPWVPPAVMREAGWDPDGAQRRSSELGVELRPLRPREFDWAAGQIFELVMALYAGLPAFRPLPKESFLRLFGALKHVLDYQATTVGVAGGRIVGFATYAPDYGRGLDVTGPGATLRAALTLARYRLRSQRYVCHYMGVERKYHGLGPLLVTCGTAALGRRGASGIGSLIHESVPTSSYFAGAITESHNYALWSARL